MSELENKMQKWRSEFERQGGTMGMGTLLHSMMADYGEQHRENVRLLNELDKVATLIGQQSLEMMRLQNLANKQAKELEEAWVSIRQYGIALMAAKNLSKEIDHTGTPKDTFTFRSIAKNMKMLMSLVDWKAIDSLTVGQEGEGNQRTIEVTLTNAGYKPHQINWDNED